MWFVKDYVPECHGAKVKPLLDIFQADHIWTRTDIKNGSELRRLAYR